MRFGIDVSDNNHPGDRPIDWTKVRAHGVDWCAVKITEGATFRSRHAGDDVHGAITAGIEVVGYHFARPATNTPQAEVDNFLGFWRLLGRRGDLALDVEDGRQLGWDALGRWVAEFVRLSGCRFVYWDRYYQTHLAHFAEIPLNRQWVAWPGALTGAEVPAIHQQSQGAVAGIEGMVDLNDVNYDRPPTAPLAHPADVRGRIVDPDTAPMLQFGNHGPSVLILKALLIHAGFPPAEGNDFGELCRKAVRAFQGAQRLPVTGIVDKRTWRVLDELWRTK